MRVSVSHLQSGKAIRMLHVGGGIKGVIFAINARLWRRPERSRVSVDTTDSMFAVGEVDIYSFGPLRFVSRGRWMPR